MPVAKKHRSSWTRDPRDISLTQHRLDILKLLTRYKYLSTPYFPALMGGGNFSNWQKLLRDMFDGGLLDRPLQQRDHFNALYRSRVYSISDKGLRALRENNVEYFPWHGSKSFAHELMASELMASVELGAKEHGVRLFSWGDILRSDSTPDSLKRAERPCRIKVRYKGNDYGLEADGHPFGIAREIEGKTRYLFCPGIEADLNTEGLRAANFERSSIVKKLTLYLEIEKSDLHRKHFGFPTFFIPFFTSDPQHLQNMKELLHDMTKGQGSKTILFGPPYPAFNTALRLNKPSGHVLTNTYDRVGYPSFHFLK